MCLSLEVARGYTCQNVYLSEWSNESKWGRASCILSPFHQFIIHKILQVVEKTYWLVQSINSIQCSVKGKAEALRHTKKKFSINCLKIAKSTYDFWRGQLPFEMLLVEALLRLQLKLTQGIMHTRTRVHSPPHIDCSRAQKLCQRCEIHVFVYEISGTIRKHLSNVHDFTELDLIMSLQ